VLLQGAPRMLLRKSVFAALLLVVLAGLGAADRRDGELLASPGKQGYILYLLLACRENR